MKDRYLDYLQMAIVAVLEAAKEVMAIYETNFEVELKADQSPVTLADKRASACIERLLQPSAIKVVCEEGEGHDFSKRELHDTIWLVDPVDGTKEFIKRNGEFSINIALIEAGVPVIGVIYAPATNDLYFAINQLGAWKMKPEVLAKQFIISENTFDNVAYPLPLQSLPTTYTIVASRSYFSRQLSVRLQQLEAEYKTVNTIQKGSSLKFCLLAEGKAHEYARYGQTMEWDTAAGHCILKESGGEVYHLQTKGTLNYNKLHLLNPEFIALAKKN